MTRTIAAYRVQGITVQCAGCLFWDQDGSQFGDCRRYSPSTAGDRAWPMTGALDWCGEFEPNEKEEETE